MPLRLPTPSPPSAIEICSELVDYYLPNVPKLETFPRTFVAQKVLEEVNKPITQSIGTAQTEQLAVMLYQ